MPLALGRFRPRRGDRAPTRILHPTDDALQRFHNAEFAASTIPGVRPIRSESGGPFLIGVDQSPIRAAVAEHILEHAGASSL